MSKTSEPTELECFSNDEIVCPYCGYTYGDSWEVAGERDGETDTMECGECGKELEYTTNISITFTTAKIDEPSENGKAK